MPEAESLSHLDISQPEPALRTAEVARLLGVSARAVRTWADDGKIACYRTFGGHRLFNVSEVRRVLVSWGRPGSGGQEAAPVPAVVSPHEPSLAASQVAAQDEQGTARG